MDPSMKWRSFQEDDFSRLQYFYNDDLALLSEPGEESSAEWRPTHRAIADQSSRQFSF